MGHWDDTGNQPSNWNDHVTKHITKQPLYELRQTTAQTTESKTSSQPAWLPNSLQATDLDTSCNTIGPLNWYRSGHEHRTIGTIHQEIANRRTKRGRAVIYLASRQVQSPYYVQASYPAFLAFRSQYSTPTHFSESWTSTCESWEHQKLHVRPTSEQALMNCEHPTASNIPFHIRQLSFASNCFAMLPPYQLFQVLNYGTVMEWGWRKDFLFKGLLVFYPFPYFCVQLS